MDEFSHVCVFSVENMRNNLLKDLRQQLGTGRFVCVFVCMRAYIGVGACAYIRISLHP